MTFTKCESIVDFVSSKEKNKLKFSGEKVFELNSALPLVLYRGKERQRGRELFQRVFNSSNLCKVQVAIIIIIIFVGLKLFCVDSVQRWYNWEEDSHALTEINLKLHIFRCNCREFSQIPISSMNYVSLVWNNVYNKNKTYGIYTINLWVISTRSVENVPALPDKWFVQIISEMSRRCVAPIGRDSVQCQ